MSHSAPMLSVCCCLMFTQNKVSEETEMQWKWRSRSAPSKETLKAINTELAHASPQDIIAWAAAMHPKKLCLATMLDAEGCALVAMIAETAVDIPVFMLDTGYLSHDVHALRELLQRQYGVAIQLVYPSLVHATFEAEYGPLVMNNPAQCCRLNRWELVRDLFHNYSARLAARRQALCPVMHDVEIAVWEERFKIVQVNPLTNWTDVQLLQYLDEQRIPHSGLSGTGSAKCCCAACPFPWEDVVPIDEQRSVQAKGNIKRFWASWR